MNTNQYLQYIPVSICVDNVNEALPQAMMLLRNRGIKRVSRGIEYIEHAGPVMTMYATPQRRVLFDPVRDANPFFHLIESLWILAGSNSVTLPQMFLSRIAQFSDDGYTFHGAYGHRLRQRFGVDQLKKVVQLLDEKPDTRQAVLSIWDPTADLGATTKDMPCNDLLMFNLRDDTLHMTVLCRSNDVILGAYGANVVQFSVLHEWVAAALNVNIGTYTQVSNSFHVYPSNPFWQEVLNGYDPMDAAVPNPYMIQDGSGVTVEPYPMAVGHEEAMLLLDDAELLCSLAALSDGDYSKLVSSQYRTDFFTRVVCPMINAYLAYKLGDLEDALMLTRYIDASDWRFAAHCWLSRRAAAKAMEQA